MSLDDIMEQKDGDVPELTQQQRNKMLIDIYVSIAGKPLYGLKGIAAKVDDHEEALYGHESGDGLIKASHKTRKYMNMVSGMLALLGALGTAIGLWLTYRLK